MFKPIRKKINEMNKNLSSYKQITPENKKMIEATVTALLGIVKENVKAEYKKFKILSK